MSRTFEDSSAIPLRHRRLWLAIGGMLVFLVIYLSLTPSPIEIPVTHGDRYGHLLAYSTLTFWFSLIYSQPRARLLLAVTFVVMSMTIEYMQGLTHYRTFEWSDIAANTLGICIGWLFAPPRVPHALEYLEARMMRRA